MTMRTLIGAAMATGVSLSAAMPAAAETLAAERRVSMVLEDGTDVLLYGAVGPARGATKYYYLPPGLTVSTGQTGRPEFLFMKFISDEAEETGGVAGAILHFLVEWGLTPEQEEEVARRLESEHNGTLAGAATIFPVTDQGPSFSIVSATLDDDELGGELITSGQAALMPGGKAAVATRLDNYGAQILGETFEEDSTITDVTAVMTMEYPVRVPGVDGTVTVEWERIFEEGEDLLIEYERELQEDARTEKRCFIVWCRDNTLDDYSYSYEETHDQWRFLEENEYVDFNFVQGDIPEEVAAPIRDAFIQYFISKVTEAQAPRPEPRETDGEDDGENRQIPDVRQGAEYTYDVERLRKEEARGTQTLSLDMDLTVRYPFQIVGNMKDWHDEAIEADPFSVQEVILGDRFYDRRDIAFILDGDLKDMFDDHVNAVTVEVRKERDGGDFNDDLLFTAETLAEGGKLRRVTYARGNDPDSEAYDYRVKWNFRGGLEYVEPPTGWEDGAWEGVTLTAPVDSRTVELEADQDELEELGIRRVTAQLRYPILGEERGTNIQMSPSRDEAIVSEKIFLDRDAEGYAFRLIFNHERLGRLATPWSARARSDNYIFAIVPDELREGLQTATQTEEVEAAQEAVTAEEDDGLAALEEHLD